jgi:hypothetical protein
VAPPALLAVTVYSANAATAVGVPEMVPVVVLKLSPPGKLGLTANALTVPVTVGVSGEIALPAINVGAWEYVKSVGAASGEVPPEPPQEASKAAARARRHLSLFMVARFPIFPSASH